MKLFIDSANFKIIKKYTEMNIFSGVTTTPTFFRREGITDISSEIKKLNDIVGEVQIEAMGNTSEEIIKSAEENAKMGSNVVSKIPINPEGIKAVKYLSEIGIKTNVHLIFSLNQAIMAGVAGATYICPLVGRLYDIGHDGIELVKNILLALKKYPEIKSEVMVSSVRTPWHVEEAALIGAEVITIPPYVIEQMFQHPLTTKGINKFEEDLILTKYVRDLMHIGPELPIVNETSEMRDVMVEMTRKNLSITTVVDETGKLVGCITDGDLRRTIQKSSSNIYDYKAKDFMTINPMTVPMDVLSQEALSIMKKYSITQLIIIDDDQKPFGIIHVHDILKYKYV